MSKNRNSTGITEDLTMRTAWQSFSGILPFLIILLLLAPVQAALINGTYYVKYSPDSPAEGTKIFYFNNNTPQNDPKEWRVNPGDTIYLGGTYDLTQVMGTSKQFAWWKDWKYESTDCNPTQVNTVSYIDSRGAVNPKMVYIDPAKYKIGNWWQWDGCYIDTSYSTYKSGDDNGKVRWLPYANDNNLAFRIINNPTPKTPEPTPEITVKVTRPITIVTTPTVNITPITTPARDGGGMPWYFWAIIIGAIILIVIFVLVM